MRIRRDHALGKDEARRRVELIAGSIGEKYRLRSDWHGDDLKFSGSGVNGCIAVQDVCIDVEVKLGFALMMLEGTLRSSIEDAMDKHLGLSIVSP